MTIISLVSLILRISIYIYLVCQSLVALAATILFSTAVIMDIADFQYMLLARPWVLFLIFLILTITSVCLLNLLKFLNHQKLKHKQRLMIYIASINVMITRLSEL